MTFHWTQENKDIVADGLKNGLSAAQIAPLVGYTRNAVIGVVHRDPVLNRIGFARRPAEQLLPRQRPQKPAAIRRTRTATVIRLPSVERSQNIGKPLVMLGAHDCRWPINDADRDEAHLFCAGTTESGKSFCPHHHHRAFDHRRSADV